LDSLRVLAIRLLAIVDAYGSSELRLEKADQVTKIKTTEMVRNHLTFVLDYGENK